MHALAELELNCVLNVSTGHKVQIVADSDENLPAGHTAQPTRPVASEYFPAGHVAQLPAWLPTWYCPDGQPTGRHGGALLEPKYFPPEEIIIFAGELCSALMIITRGLAVLSRKHGVSNVMQMGDHFGEEIILLDCFVFYTVKSMTYLNVNSLPQDKLQVLFIDCTVYRLYYS